MSTASPMRRWKALATQHLRWSSPVAKGLVLCIITFGFVLPLCCHKLLYSYYYIKSVYLNDMSDKFLAESYERGEEAFGFWKASRSTAMSPEFANIAKGSELLITIVTARRTEGREFHYLLQVMQRLEILLTGCGEGRRCAEVLVCDVESGTMENEDAALLESRFRVVRRTTEEQRGNQAQVNIFEKEKQDYVYCLRKGWELARPKNVVVLEDDALPSADFFTVIRDLLSRRFALHSLYVKLYHPERLQRYWNPEPYRILEWVGLGLVGASALLLVLSYRTAFTSVSATHFLFFTLYIMVAVELAGRHYLLEVRRLSPQLYAVSPATECCTPAMLFPGNSSLRVAEYLDGSFCVKGNAKDMVLYQMARTISGEWAHSLEPNLVSHIGAFSSVRPNPLRPKLL
ncbi:transmembrane protein 246 [Esox lucius]|uniref:Post-GPI attachment to proteins GalNAc transferase 4 n=1 Tax=Esox lucius TaxID=8010 RepID=A0AAY5L931_ESOLU|nr:transmembrane protein 246 [Esox lucius]